MKSRKTARSKRLTAEKAKQKAVMRIIRETGRGTLGIRFEAMRLMMLANRVYVRQMSSGDDYFQTREFQEGDSWTAVDARRTMQSTNEEEIMVKEYRPELQETWYIIFDGSPTNDFAGLRQNKLDVCARAACAGLTCAQVVDDRVGFIVYSGSEIVCHIPPSQPRNILLKVVETILDPPYAEGDPDLGLEKAFSLVPKNGTVNIIWLSDCLNLNKRGTRVLSQMSRLKGTRKLVVPWDERERILPKASVKSLWIPPRIKVFDMRDHTAHNFLCTEANRAQYTAEWDEHIGYLKKMAKRKRIGSVFVQTEHQGDVTFASEKHKERALEKQRRKAIQEILRLFASL
jgi:hypothetical protein